MHQQTYLAAPKHVCAELIKLNGVRFKDNFLFIENAKVKPKVTNKINFISPNRFQPLRLVKNSPGLGNDIDHSEERFACRF